MSGVCASSMFKHVCVVCVYVFGMWFLHLLEIILLTSQQEAT